MEHGVPSIIFQEICWFSGGSIAWICLRWFLMNSFSLCHGKSANLTSRWLKYVWNLFIRFLNLVLTAVHFSVDFFRWWFHFFLFSPLFGDRFPIWLAHIFQMGWGKTTNQKFFVGWTFCLKSKDYRRDVRDVEWISPTLGFWKKTHFDSKKMAFEKKTCEVFTIYTLR